MPAIAVQPVDVLARGIHNVVAGDADKREIFAIRRPGRTGLVFPDFRQPLHVGPVGIHDPKVPGRAMCFGHSHAKQLGQPPCEPAGLSARWTDRRRRGRFSGATFQMARLEFMRTLPFVLSKPARSAGSAGLPAGPSCPKAKEALPVPSST